MGRAFGFAHGKIFWYTSAIPVAIVFVILIVSAFTGIVFSIETNAEGVKNIVNGPAYPVIVVPPFAYFIVIFILSTVSAAKTKSLLKRREYIWLSVAMGLIVASVLGLSVLFLHLTILPMAVFAAIYITFTSLQESGINNDSLTGLNNRRRANEYLKEYDHPVWKKFVADGVKGGHGGMDYLVYNEFAECLFAGKPFPITIYDAAAWMAVTPLSAISIKEHRTVEFPDFVG